MTRLHAVPSRLLTLPNIPFLLLLLLVIPLYFTHIFVPLRTQHLQRQSRLHRPPVYQHRWPTTITSTTTTSSSHTSTPSSHSATTNYILPFPLKHDINLSCGQNQNPSKDTTNTVRLMQASHLVHDCGYKAAATSPLLIDYHAVAPEQLPGQWEWNTIGRDYLLEHITRHEYSRVEERLSSIRKEVEGMGDGGGMAFWGRVEMLARTAMLLRTFGVCREHIEEFSGILERLGGKYWEVRRRRGNVKREGKEVWEVDGETWTLAARAAVLGVIGNVGTGNVVRKQAQSGAKKLVEKVVRFQSEGGNGLYCGKSGRDEYDRLFRNALTAQYLARLYAVSRTHSLHKMIASSLREALDVKRIRVRLKRLEIGKEKKRTLHSMYADVLIRTGEMLRNGKFMKLVTELTEGKMTERKGKEMFRKVPWKRCEYTAVR